MRILRTLAPLLTGTFVIVVVGAGCGGSVSSSAGNGGAAGASGGASGAGTGGSAGASGGAGGTGATGGSAGTGGAAGAGGGTCVSNKDCPNNQVCGYAVSAGCAAKGRCFPAPGAVCDGYSPGCACDGTEISVVCTGLPNGYVEKPLAHPGQCASGVKFPCGSSLSCDSTIQYCKEASGGPCCNPPSYSCEPIPASCAQDHSCACIASAVGAQDCSESAGGVTVRFFYP